MAVSDAQVATLRAQLAGHLDEYLDLLGQIDNAPDRQAYSALVVAGFCEAVERRFGKNSEKADVVSFVAEVRATSEAAAQKIDPQAAERLITAVYTDEDVSDVGADQKKDLYVLLLPALIGDEQFSEAELDKFLVDSRRLADQWLS
jgi:hypothetical protein